MIAIKSKQIVYDLGSTGGEFAAHCLYYAEKGLEKKASSWILYIVSGM